MGKNRHCNGSIDFNSARRDLQNFTPIELLVAELMRYHLHNDAIASLLGVTENKIKIFKKNIYQKTGCLNEDDLVLYIDVYLMSVKNRFRNIG